MANSLTSLREGAGQPLVFLHGLGTSKSQASAATADVVGVERIVVDAPGHGGSADSTVPLNFGSFAEAIIGHLDELNVERAIFGGISMGASLALRIARDVPERVKALVLVRPAWLDGPGSPHLDIVSDIGRWIQDAGPESARHCLEADERYQRMVANEPLAAGSINRAIGGVATTGRPDVLVEMVASQPIANMAELTEIHQPALVIATERDELHPTYIAERIATALPNAKCLMAPPRYIEPIAHQDFVAQSINSFIEEIQTKNSGTAGGQP